MILYGFIKGETDSIKVLKNVPGLNLQNKK